MRLLLNILDKILMFLFPVQKTTVTEIRERMATFRPIRDYHYAPLALRNADEKTAFWRPTQHPQVTTRLRLPEYTDFEGTTAARTVRDFIRNEEGHNGN